MDLKESDVLRAFMAYGVTDEWLNGNPNVTLYSSPSYKRFTRSQFTFKTLKFTYEANRNCYFTQAKVERFCDLMGWCNLLIRTRRPLNVGNIYNIIKSITCFTKNQQAKSKILETLNGTTLEVMAHQRTKAEYEQSQDGVQNIMIPLPFFFTQKTSSFLPLTAMLNANTCFECTLNDNIEADAINQIQLVYQCVSLDTNERMSLTKKPRETLCTLTHTNEFEIVVAGIDSNAQDYVPHKINLPSHNYVKDIRALIRRTGTDGNDEECVGQLNIVINGTTHMSLNSMMARKIIPRQFYKYENTEPIYHIPFCHDPWDYTLNSSHINLGRLNSRCLELFLKPGTYSITLVTQHMNLLAFNNGLCAFVYDEYDQLETCD